MVRNRSNIDRLAELSWLAFGLTSRRYGRGTAVPDCTNIMRS
jgi:hypothetical protein